MTAPLFYRFIRGLLRLGCRAFFREVELHGRENIPAEGPLLMLANHHNGMIDPFLLMAASDRPVTFVAKAPLFKIPILGWILRGLHCMPAYRSQEADQAREKNQALFDAAARALAEGRALGLFPEGKSHLDPKLAELKHGASKIAFDAEAKGVQVGVVLVGIHFEKWRGFRGRVLVQIPPPLTLEAWRERYAQDPKAAVAALTDELHRRLSEMILSAENRETVRLAELVEKMVALDAPGEEGLKAAFERKKAILEGYALLREKVPDRVEALREDLRAYRGFLDALRVRDDQVAGDYRAGRAIGYALRNTVALAVGLPLVAAGLALNLVPYVLTRLLARSGKELDERTSIGFMVGLFAFPLAWAGLAVAGWFVARTWGAVAAGLAGPVTGAFALFWMDRWHRVAQATWGLWTALALPAARAKLRRLRQRILARLQKLIELRKTLAT